jgi:hypothetical protein
MNVVIIAALALLVLVILAIIFIGRMGASDQSGLANPASKHCTAEGGTVEIINNEDGSQTGYCHTYNGLTCDEWKYYKGGC